MAWLERTANGTPIYARWTDLSEAADESSRKVRHTTVFMRPERRDVLQITTVNNAFDSEYRPARLTVEQARQFRDILDEFLADQNRPESDFTPPPRARAVNPFDTIPVPVPATEYIPSTGPEHEAR